MKSDSGASLPVNSIGTLVTRFMSFKYGTLFNRSVFAFVDSNVPFLVDYAIYSLLSCTSRLVEAADATLVNVMIGYNFLYCGKMSCQCTGIA